MKSSTENTLQKLIIAGAGPAGISAALYAVRAGITPLILYKDGGALEKAKITMVFPIPFPESNYMKMACFRYRLCLFPLYKKSFYP